MNDSDMTDAPNDRGWIALGVGAIVFLAASTAFLATGMKYIGGEGGQPVATAASPAPPPAGNEGGKTGQSAPAGAATAPGPAPATTGSAPAPAQQPKR